MSPVKMQVSITQRHIPSAGLVSEPPIKHLRRKTQASGLLLRLRLRSTLVPAYVRRPRDFSARNLRLSHPHIRDAPVSLP